MLALTVVVSKSSGIYFHSTLKVPVVAGAG